ncbi:MAG: hypothetical protein ACOC0R_03970 [Mariniphaga sp.]
MAANRFSQLFAEADAAFKGAYKNELNQLEGLSREEIDSVIPGTEDLTVYSVLVKVVEQASRENKSQASLIADIRELGSVAVNIARKVPRFASLL